MQTENKETQALNDTLDQMDTTIQNLGDTEKAVLRRKFSKTILLQKTRKISSKQPNLTAKATRERKTKLRVSRRNHKDLSRNKWRQ